MAKGKLEREALVVTYLGSQRQEDPWSQLANKFQVSQRPCLKKKLGSPRGTLSRLFFLYTHIYTHRRKDKNMQMFIS